MIWMLLLAVLTLAVVYQARTGSGIHRNGHKLRRPPSTLPLLGNAVKFLQPRHLLFDWFVQCRQEFGPETLEISVPSLPPGVLINSADNLEFILKNETSITKGEFFRKRSWDLFGYGIINATGDLWRAQRKAGLKFFSGANLDALVKEVLPEVYAETRQSLLRQAADNSTVDLQQVFLDLTTTVVGVLAYDMEIDASSPFSKAFDYASDHVGLRFQNPLYHITELFNGAQFWASLAEVKRFGREIVATARKRRSHAAFESLITNEEVVFGSLMDSLMETFNNSSVVADAALNFLSAGRDTTAQSLTWAFYAMMRHPELVRDLRQEIDGVLESGTDVDMSKLQPSTVPRIMAFYYEALRLYPPVPFEIKQCEVDVTLPDGTFLPKTSVVLWCIWSMNRAKETFGDDAHLFRPSRWLDERGRLVNKTPFEFPVFNGGPRACLGKKMAEVMGAWLILHMVRDFDFDEIRDPAQPERERVSQNSLTLPMQNGLPCKVKKRKS